MRHREQKDLIQNFRMASRQYSDNSIFMHEAIARKAGLAGSDHKYLGLIMQHTELTAGDIAELTGLTTGAVTGLIDRLEKKNLVKRQFTQEDRRKVIIVPNRENIAQLMQPLFEDLQAKTGNLLSSFSEEEIRTIHRYFTEATTIMKEVTNILNSK